MLLNDWSDATAMAEAPTINPVNPVDPTVASKVSDKTKPVVSKVVTTPNGKVFFVSTANETLKETEKVTETPSQTESLPTTGEKAHMQVSLNLVCF